MAPHILTRTVNAESVATKAEDLSADCVEGRLRQAFQFADFLAESVDDVLQMLQYSHSALDQLTSLNICAFIEAFHTSYQSPQGSRRRSAS